jgi:hypothetical protein
MKYPDFGEISEESFWVDRTFPRNLLEGEERFSRMISNFLTGYMTSPTFTMFPTCHIGKVREK